MEYYADDLINDDNLDPSLVKNPSTFNPAPNRILILGRYIDYLTKYPLEEESATKKKTKYNIKIDKWEAIMQLKNDCNLIIKEGDKVEACVIMDRDFYRGKMLSLLNDKKTYKEINNPST